MTVVTAEAAIPYSKTYLGDIDARTSLEVALATPRPGDVVPVAPVPAPPTAVAA